MSKKISYRAKIGNSDLKDFFKENKNKKNKKNNKNINKND